MSAFEREAQAKRVHERDTVGETAEMLADDLHREIGERLTGSFLGILDFLAGIGRQSHTAASPDADALLPLFRQALSAELEPIKAELRDLRAAIDEIRSGITRIDRFTMNRLLGISTAGETAPDTDNARMAGERPLPAQPSGRAPRATVVERVLSTARRLQESGQDIKAIPSTELARLAGVKPAQFTYAFKTRDNFISQFEAWLEQQSA